MQKLISKYFGSLELALVSIFIVVLPFVFGKRVLDPALYTRVLALSLVLVLLGVLLLQKSLKSKIIFSLNKAERLVFALAALFFINHIVSSFGSINKTEAIFHTLKEGGFMLFFFYLYIIIRANEKGRTVLIKSIIVTTFVFLLIGVKQVFNANFDVFLKADKYFGYYLTQALWDVKSTLASKNPFSSFLYLALPFIFYGMFMLRRFWRILSIITLTLNFIFLGLLVSKTVWAATAVFLGLAVLLLFVYVFYLLPRYEDRVLPVWQKVAVVAMPVLLFGGGILFVATSNSSIANVVKDKVLQVINPDEQLVARSKDNPSSLEMREIAWRKTYSMIKDNPLLGVGPGQWRICFPKYGLDEFNAKVRNGETHFQRPHNDWLWIASEVGVVGLLIFVALYLYVLILALKSFLAQSSKDRKVLNGFIFASLIGYILVLFVTFSRERVPHNILYLSMFALVLLDVSKSNITKTEEKGKKYIILFLLGMLVFSLYYVRVSYDFYKGDAAAYSVKYFKDIRKNWHMVLKSSEKTKGSYYTLDPFSMPLSYYEGTALHKLNLIDRAQECFLEAYKQHPYHILTLNNLGTSYDLKGEPDKAIPYYEKAIEISPRFMDPVLNLSIIYYNKKQPYKALATIVRIKYSKDLPPRYHEALMAICKQYAISIHNMYDEAKLVDWIKDEDKILGTFITFQQEKRPFDKILREDLTK